MSKKTLLALVILVALLILGIGVYLLFFTAPSIGNPDAGNNYNPFGNYSGSSTTTPTTNTASSTTQGDTTYVNSATARLVKISAAPIAGAGSFERKVVGTATTTSIVRYTERATGHTVDYNEAARTLTNISNTTIPSIYRAWWLGSNLLAQFLDEDKETIKTYAGALPTNPTSTTALSGSFLTNNIYNLAVSPKGNRVFYLQTGESAVGTIVNIDGSKRSQIFNFPFNEWVTEWSNESTITLTTKASYNTQGFMYFLGSASGVMTKAFGNVAGLSTRTSPTLNYALYSASTNSGVATAIYDFKNNNSFPLSNQTLAEKCVWSTLNKTVAYCAVPTSIPIGNYPDDWYQGRVSFVDNIYKIDASLPAMQLLYSLPQDQNIDATKLFLDQKENNLYFTNKKDHFLWGLTIKNY